MTGATRTGLLRAAAATLRAAGVDDAPTDARLLFCHVTGLDRADLLREPGAPVDAGIAERFRTMVDARAGGKPVGRIIGHRGFWGLDFRLCPATLEPRPDTEAVVEAVLAALPDRDAPLRILDLGTGTGCILLALLHEMPRARGLGLDIAAGAVDTARENAARFGLSARAKFALASWTSGIPAGFDVAVSNPPYIESAAIAGLEREVRDHDPHVALDGGADGLEAYRLIVGGAKNAAIGRLFFELGAGQDRDVASLAAAAGYGVMLRHHDLGGHLRCLGLVLGGGT